LKDFAVHVVLQLLALVTSRGQTIIEEGIVRPQDKDDVEPTFRKEIGDVMFNDNPALTHQIFKFVNNFVLVEGVALEFLVPLFQAVVLLGELADVDALQGLDTFTQFLAEERLANPRCSGDQDVRSGSLFGEIGSLLHFLLHLG